MYWIMCAENCNPFLHCYSFLIVRSLKQATWLVTSYKCRTFQSFNLHEKLQVYTARKIGPRWWLMQGLLNNTLLIYCVLLLCSSVLLSSPWLMWDERSPINHAFHASSFHSNCFLHIRTLFSSLSRGAEGPKRTEALYTDWLAHVVYKLAPLIYGRPNLHEEWHHCLCDGVIRIEVSSAMF